MNVKETALPGVMLIEPDVFGDHRGFFVETFHHDRYNDMGIPYTFVQDNHSRSSQGVLRGLHFQLKHPQGKLVRVTRGEVFDVAVDIRVGSPTFGQSVGVVLNEDNQRQLFVPPGFAHGFCVMSDTADFLYKCTDYYHPEDEGGVLWSDAALGIDWPVNDPQLSEKDTLYKTLADTPVSMLPQYEKEEVA